MHELFHDGDPYHIETSPLICRYCIDCFYDRDLRHKRFNELNSPPLNV